MGIGSRLKVSVALKTKKPQNLRFFLLQQSVNAEGCLRNPAAYFNGLSSGFQFLHDGF